MSEDRSTELLSALPRTRPHRRSVKRGARPAAGGSAPEPSTQAKPAERSPRSAGAARTATAPRKARSRPASSTAKPLRQPAQPRGIPKARRAPKRKPAPATGAEIVGTAFQAAGELAELGLALTARALRNAASRLPRP